jgi:hypothetical protein
VLLNQKKGRNVLILNGKSYLTRDLNPDPGVVGKMLLNLVTPAALKKLGFLRIFEDFQDFLRILEDS